jgi:hypothetical protein
MSVRQGGGSEWMKVSVWVCAPVRTCFSWWTYLMVTRYKCWNWAPHAFRQASVHYILLVKTCTNSAQRHCITCHFQHLFLQVPCNVWISQYKCVEKSVWSFFIFYFWLYIFCMYPFISSTVSYDAHNRPSEKNISLGNVRIFGLFQVGLAYSTVRSACAIWNESDF